MMRREVFAYLKNCIDMSKYYLTSDEEETLEAVKINPDYVNAMIEVAHNERIYSNPDNLPPLMKQFIAIAKEKGIELEVKYGMVDSVVGFSFGANGKGSFASDKLVDDEPRHEEGIRWFKKSLEATFNK